MVLARKRHQHRSVVAAAKPLGNAGHDQMNQQRQLIARQGPRGGSVATPPSPSASMRTADLSAPERDIAGSRSARSNRPAIIAAAARRDS